MQPADQKRPRQRGQPRSQRDGLIGAAREMRSQPTVAEDALWQALRRKQAGGMRFRRQRVIGPYIVDFCCSRHKLIVEVDGAHHRHPDNRAYDEDRTMYLEANGFRVLRFENADVMQDVERVVNEIMHPYPPAPFPSAEGQGERDHSPPLSSAEGQGENDRTEARSSHSRTGERAG